MAARCKYGKLKNPIGRRRCKKPPRSGRRLSSGLSGLGRPRRRKSGTKGRTCVRRKRGADGVMRCASFGGLGAAKKRKTRKKGLRGDVKTCVQYAKYPKAGGGSVTRCALFRFAGKGRKRPGPGIRKAAGMKSRYRYRTAAARARTAATKARGARKHTAQRTPQALRRRA